MQVTPLELPDVLLIEPTMHRDGRGAFMETFSAERYRLVGIPGEFVQDNVSMSRHGVLRGLHFQHPRAQAKLVTVLSGEVFDVAVDVRAGSPTFGQWVGATLTGDNGRQLFVPVGFAHGFVALTDGAILAYKCTDYYAPESEWCLRWDDPEIGIRWPVAAPNLSDRDRKASFLRDIPSSRLPVFRGSAAPTG